MTIFISGQSLSVYFGLTMLRHPHAVVSEAYTSRYKGLLGRNSFKHVARQYRKRTKVELRESVQRIGTSRGTKSVLQDTLEREKTVVVQEESLPADAAGDSITFAIASTSQSDPHVQAQQSLEKLPKQVLTETRSIQRYMQLVGGRSADAEKFVDESVWSLMDDVMGGKQLTEGTKQDILRDDETRQVRDSRSYNR